VSGQSSLAGSGFGFFSIAKSPYHASDYEKSVYGPSYLERNSLTFGEGGLTLDKRAKHHEDSAQT